MHKLQHRNSEQETGGVNKTVSAVIPNKAT